ncbi:hypothetical protein SAMN05444158_4684 [Bradyrhizobium canariense]|uniref:Uncharacterized protein n=1 Tax=Bradyrhizobium canariense TaxID=255045 RepID=A0A1H1Y8I2_9BRAD|nr:hypothetical protein SAMN05444158_4684 [Bradyrhizobium canariense]
MKGFLCFVYPLGHMFEWRIMQRRLRRYWRPWKGVLGYSSCLPIDFAVDEVKHLHCGIEVIKLLLK